MGNSVSEVESPDQDTGPPAAKKRKCTDDISYTHDEYENRVDPSLDEHTETERNSHSSKKEYDALRKQYELEKDAKDDALRRSSDAASSKLRDNNPDIADLSDDNRPTKLAEKLSELYDNQWTDAFDVLRTKMNESETIEYLRELLMGVFDGCMDIAWDKYFEKVQCCIELPLPVRGTVKQSWTSIMPDQLKKEIKDFRKSRALHVVKDVEKVIKDQLLQQHKKHTYMYIEEAVRKCISACTEVVWPMVVQDPPMVLSTTSKLKFDRNIYKEYTKRGPYVEYVVWPAVYLHENGPLLSKGVAQGCF